MCLPEQPMRNYDTETRVGSNGVSSHAESMRWVTMREMQVKRAPLQLQGGLKGGIMYHSDRKQSRSEDYGCNLFPGDLEGEKSARYPYARVAQSSPTTLSKGNLRRWLKTSCPILQQPSNHRTLRPQGPRLSLARPSSISRSSCESHQRKVPASRATPCALRDVRLAPSAQRPCNSLRFSTVSSFRWSHFVRSRMVRREKSEVEGTLCNMGRCLSAKAIV